MRIDKPLESQLLPLQLLWQEAFNDTDEFLNDFFMTAFSADRCRCVTVNEEPAAALYWFDCVHMGSKAAYLYGVATAEKYRGQGLCSKLMEDTHNYLKMLGYKGVILVPGSRSLFSMYERMGYKTCSGISEFRCSGETADRIELRRIEKNEYAELRRLMLPEGGVVQENENLDLLQTQEEFYSGSGFLLTAHGEGDTIYGVELLGDKNAASGIVKTLGYAEGVFRIPGDDKPFAMYYPLHDSKCKPPSYFGLAFDL